METPLPVCPDDLGAILQSHAGWQCSVCARHYVVETGYADLLPRQSLEMTSPERAQLERYAASFSRRNNRAWLQPLREVVMRLGNGYLYRWAAARLRSLACGSNLSILDAACGDGIMATSVPAHSSYVGIDFSERVLTRARRFRRGVFYRADLAHIPFSARVFDAIVCLQALHYFDEPELVTTEFARVLRAGGTLLLAVPNDRSRKYRTGGPPLLQRSSFDDPGLRELLSRVGLRVCSLESRGIWLRMPRISVHLPGVSDEGEGLAWTVEAVRD